MATEREETARGDAREERSHVMQLLAIGLIASVIGIALGLLIDWFPAAGAPTQAEKVDTLWDVLIIFSVPVFVLVTTVVLYCVWRFRMKPGEEELDGPPIHGNTRLEIIWTAIPAILLVALCSYSYVSPDRHRGRRRARAQRARRRRAVHLDLLLPRRLRQGGRLAAALRPARPAGQLHRPVARTSSTTSGCRPSA